MTDLIAPPTAPAAFASPFAQDPAAFAQALARADANRAQLLAWIRTHLIAGRDYGPVHFVRRSKCPHAATGNVEACRDPSHWSRPALWKAGAEKLCQALALSVAFPTLAEVERAAVSGVALGAIVLRCELTDREGNPVGEGIGARLVAEDDGDLNKALKMAAKRALVDAVVRTLALGEIFDAAPAAATVPRADDPPGAAGSRPPGLPPRATPLAVAGSPPRATPPSPVAASPSPATPAEDEARLRAYLAHHGLTERGIAAQVHAPRLAGLAPDQLAAAWAYAKKIAAARAGKR